MKLSEELSKYEGCKVQVETVGNLVLSGMLTCAEEDFICLDEDRSSPTYIPISSISTLWVVAEIRSGAV